MCSKQIGVFQFGEKVFDPGGQPIDIDDPPPGEVGHIELFGVDGGNRLGDELERPLEPLDDAVDRDERAVFKFREDVGLGVPEARVDRAGPVGQDELEIEFAALVRAKRTFRHLVDFGNVQILAKLIDKSTIHKPPCSAA